MNDATPFLDSTDVISDGSEMHIRMQRDGYLFVRGLLPTELLDSLRLKFLTIARNAGWVEKGRPLTEAFANLDSFGVEPNSDYMSIYGEILFQRVLWPCYPMRIVKRIIIIDHSIGYFRVWYFSNDMQYLEPPDSEGLPTILFLHGFTLQKQHNF